MCDDEPKVLDPQCSVMVILYDPMSVRVMEKLPLSTVPLVWRGWVRGWWVGERVVGW